MTNQMQSVLLNTQQLHLCGVLLNMCGIHVKSVDELKAKYVSYFENEHGSPAIFVSDRHTMESWLYTSRDGWAKPHQVVEGKVQGLRISDVEAIWLFNCWSTAALLSTPKLKVVPERVS